MGREYPLILIFPRNLKGRGVFGSRILNIMIEAWENINARRDPKAYNEPTLSKAFDEKNPGISKIIPTMLKRIIDTYGV